MEHMSDTIGGQEYFDQGYNFELKVWEDVNFNEKPCYFTKDFLVNSRGFNESVFTGSRIVNVPKELCKNQDKNYILVKDIDFDESPDAPDFAKLYLCFEVREDLDLEKYLVAYSWKAHQAECKRLQEENIRKTTASAGIGAIFPEGYVKEKPVRKSAKQTRKLIAKRK